MQRLLLSITYFLILVVAVGCKHEEYGDTDGRAKLESGIWKLMHYGLITEELKEFPANKLSTIYFSARNNVVKGFVLCNSFESMYTVTGSTISIDSVAPTELYCGEDREGLASFIVTSLSSISRYEVDGEVLRLYSTESRVLQYKKE